MVSNFVVKEFSNIFVLTSLCVTFLLVKIKKSFYSTVNYGTQCLLFTCRNN